jgi:hypothetical protein
MTDFAFSTARRRRLWFFENLRQKKKNRKKARPKSHPRFSRELDRMPPRWGVRRNARRSRAGVPRPPKRRFSVVRRKGRRESRESFGVRACRIFGACAAGRARLRVPAGDASGDDRPLVAVHGVRGEDFLVLLLGERPALHRGVELVAPPARKE